MQASGGLYDYVRYVRRLNPEDCEPLADGDTCMLVGHGKKWPWTW